MTFCDLRQKDVINTRDGRSLIVATLDHNQLAELYTARTELEALAARLAARHATREEVLAAWDAYCG